MMNKQIAELKAIPVKRQSVHDFIEKFRGEPQRLEHFEEIINFTIDQSVLDVLETIKRQSLTGKE